MVLLSLALASGGLAASQVSGTVGEVERRVGRPVAVVVAARDLAPQRAIRAGAVALRKVPARFVPPGAASSVEEVSGLRPAVPVAAGSYLTEGQLEGAASRRGRGGLAPGERAVEIGVAGGEALSESGAPGGRVDVLVSTEGGSGRGRSFLALEDVELLSLRAAGTEAGAAGGDSSARRAPSAVATLRVTLRQAVYLTAAENFAREVRLLPRPPGDRQRLGREAVGAGGL